MCVSVDAHDIHVCDETFLGSRLKVQGCTTKVCWPGFGASCAFIGWACSCDCKLIPESTLRWSNQGNMISHLNNWACPIAVALNSVSHVA